MQLKVALETYLLVPIWNLRINALRFNFRGVWHLLLFNICKFCVGPVAQSV
jgi:hypothetical protein